MNTFAESSLLATLAGLPMPCQSAFAQACALRLLREESSPLAGDVYALCLATLSSARAYLDDGAFDERTAVSLRERLEAHPDVDDDRVAACAFVVRHLLSGEPQEAFWAARRAYEARDQMAQDSLDFDTYTPEIVAKLLSHPSVQGELALQAADVEDLQREPALMKRIVDRAATR